MVAFEPQRQVFQTLCANVALNSLSNVLTFHAGLSHEPGAMRLMPPDYQQVGNFGAVSLSEQDGGEPVQIMALDHIGLPAISLIKIDVEGMETEVLRGAQKTISTSRPIMYIENDRPEKSLALMQTIFDLGYRAYWHISPLFNPNNFAGNEENVFEVMSSLNLLCVPSELDQNIAGLKEVQAADEFPALS